MEGTLADGPGALMDPLDFLIGVSRWKPWQRLVVGFLLACWWELSGLLWDGIRWELFR